MSDHIPTTRSIRRHTFWLTTMGDEVSHVDHAVPYEEMASGLGTYTAVCGMVVHPTAMSVPPGWRCTRCVAVLEAGTRRHGPHKHRRGHYQSGWLGRVLGW